MSKLKVTFDDDGQAWVDTNELEARVGNTITQKEANLLRYMGEKEKLTAQEQAQMNRKQELADILSKDERYNDARNRLETVLLDINDRIKDFQYEHNLGGEVDPLTALHILDRTGQLEEIQKLYPDVDPVVALDSLRSTAQFEMALKDISTKLPDPQADTPQGIIQSNSGMDILEMSDNDVQAIMDKLAKEEEEGGIDW